MKKKSLNDHYNPKDDQTIGKILVRTDENGKLLWLKKEIVWLKGNLFGNSFYLIHLVYYKTFCLFHRFHY